MIKRNIEPLVSRYASEYPAVTVLGPRQAGKSTTVRKLFPNHSCANLEVRETRLLAETDARAFFSMYPPPVIIDEVQIVPDLLGEVQAMIDADRRACGRFILTGSHQSALSSAVSQTLAGRTAIADMMPLEFFPKIPFVAILGNRPNFPLKPDAEVVGEVLRKTGIKKEEAVMVGDSDTDMETAANGGIMGIAVGWGYRDMKDYVNQLSALRQAQGPLRFKVVDSADELQKILLP